jgi:prolyl-tRNA synthetase
MRQSALFTKTRKEAPKGETSRNAQLLIRGGFIYKEMAGAYTLLPLGLRVFKKIEHIIRTEMNRIGGQEMRLTTLQDPSVWKASGRWDEKAVDIWFKTMLANGSEVGIANTHEEPLTRILAEHITSYKELPAYIYQIQTKFRNELRAKSGVMRVREFTMKDLYSYTRTEEEHKDFYEKCARAYASIFELVGLGDITYRTFASGGSFSKFSDEFQTLSEAGEDTIYVHEGKQIAVNKEVYTNEVLAELGLGKEELVERKAIEVGNIFPLGTRFAEALNFKVRGEDGKEQYPIMGCYGIGLERLMGTVAEVLSDERGLNWPATLSPFDLHLIELSGGNEDIRKQAGDLYRRLHDSGVDVLFDDRDIRAGEKFADSDLIGIPYRAVLSEKTAKEGNVELVTRKTGETQLITEEALLGMHT